MYQGELCSICKKRVASVFITKMDEKGNQVNQGICLVCAKKMGLPQVNQMLERMGISDEELENISNEMSEMMSGLAEEDEKASLEEGEEEAKESRTNTPNLFQFFRQFGPMMGGPRGQQDDLQAQSEGVPQERQEETEKESKEGKSREKKPRYKHLAQYGTNLNDKALRGEIDPVVGRDRELDRVIQILNRRTKNNPVLIGEPGVGKTAIAESLALKITQGEVPYKLLSMEVFLLDLTAMVAGTQFRGQFEARMKAVLDEVKKAGNIILVIDEVHNMMGAGEAEGSLNAANIMKPALSRGEIQVIGATTLKEYRKYIEKDGALERRFQPVYVEEPSVEETVEILKGVRERYETYHKVTVSDALLLDIAKMSERYITDRFLPDKAIDVLDEAASRANLRNMVLLEIEKVRKQLEENQAQQDALAAQGSEDRPVIATPSEGEDAAAPAPEEDVQMELFRKIAECKSEQAVLQAKLAELEKVETVPILFDDVAAVIEHWTGIPVQTISEAEVEKLLALESRLQEKVIGQEAGVLALSKAIRRNRSGFRKRYKPSSFIFVGPTGVGKTELAKQIAIELFGSSEALVRLDMSEYMEKHTVSKLIGSPPGYVGYDEAGQLTERIRRKPYSVILLDEIEKAHEDVFNMLLQILDDGRLTDSQGRTVNFENTIIIMTSNAGTSLKSGSIGFSSDGKADTEAQAQAALQKIFRPEFLNRVDEVIVFQKLDRQALCRITRLMLQDVLSQCEDKGIVLDIEEDVVSYLAEHGYDEKYGARPLRRLIQKTIEDELSDRYLHGQLPVGSVWKAILDGDRVVIAESGKS